MRQDGLIDASAVRPLTPEEHRLVATRRLQAVDAAPYLAALLLAMPVYAVDGITASVDRSARLYLGMDFFAALTPDEAVGVLLHEVRHIVQAHNDRATAHGVTRAQRGRWNLAADLTINDELIDGGFVLPEGAACCAAARVDRGHSVEIYFELLGSLPEDDGPSCGSGAGGQPTDWELPDEVPRAGPPLDHGRRTDTDRASGDEAQAETSGPEGDEAGRTEADGTPGEGDEAGRTEADGTPGEGDEAGRSEADGTPDEGAERGDVDAVSTSMRGMRPLEIDLARRQVAEDVARHVAGHGAGSVPGALRDWADDQLRPPTVPWRDVLRTAVRRPLRRSAGVDDYTWARPNRRRRSGAIVLPSTVGTQPGVVVVVDTSGSIAPRHTRAFVGELVAMVAQFRSHARDVLVIPCDTDAHAPIPADQVIAERALPTGGGTDLRAGIDAACALRPSPDLIVVFTDGRTPWPAEPPRGDMVIVISRGGTDRGVPDWATVVKIDESIS